MCVSEETILMMDHGVAEISEIVAMELMREDTDVEDAASTEPANDSVTSPYPTTFNNPPDTVK